MGEGSSVEGVIFGQAGGDGWLVMGFWHLGWVPPTWTGSTSSVARKVQTGIQIFSIRTQSSHRNFVQKGSNWAGSKLFSICTQSLHWNNFVHLIAGIRQQLPCRTPPSSLLPAPTQTRSPSPQAIATAISPSATYEIIHSSMEPSPPYITFHRRNHIKTDKTMDHCNKKRKVSNKNSSTQLSSDGQSRVSKHLESSMGISIGLTI